MWAAVSLHGRRSGANTEVSWLAAKKERVSPLPKPKPVPYDLLFLLKKTVAVFRCIATHFRRSSFFTTAMFDEAVRTHGGRFSEKKNIEEPIVRAVLGPAEERPVAASWKELQLSGPFTTSPSDSTTSNSAKWSSGTGYACNHVGPVYVSPRSLRHTPRGK